MTPAKQRRARKEVIGKIETAEQVLGGQTAWWGRWGEVHGCSVNESHDPEEARLRHFTFGVMKSVTVRTAEWR
jgi:hypothetical protein